MPMQKLQELHTAAFQVSWYYRNQPGIQNQQRLASPSSG